MIAVLVGWLLGHRAPLRPAPPRRTARAIGVDAVVARRGAAAARAPCSSARRARAARSSRRSTTATRPTCSTATSRCAPPRCSSSTTTRASGRCRSCAGRRRPRYGVWLFYAAAPDEQRAARGGLRPDAAPWSFGPARRTSCCARPTRLAPRGADSRSAAPTGSPGGARCPRTARVNELLIADRQLLQGRCVPYGDLGDPDISPALAAGRRRPISRKTVGTCAGVASATRFGDPYGVSYGETATYGRNRSRRR